MTCFVARRACAFQMGRLVHLIVGALLARIAAARDLYGELGLERGASASEVKRAYRSLSLIYHPDKQRGSDHENRRKASERFVEIQNAYSVLSDPERKRTYDLQVLLEHADASNSKEGSGNRMRGTWDSGSLAEGLRQRGSFQQAELLSSETIPLNERNVQKLVFNSKRTWLIQIYDDSIEACHRSWPAWEKASRTLDGIAKFGRVDALTSPHLVQLLGSSGVFSNPIRRSDLPVIIGVRPNCGHYSCAKRYRGFITVEDLASFVSDRLLMLRMLSTIPKEDVRSTLSGRKSSFILISSKKSPLMTRTRYLAEEYRSNVDVWHVNFQKSDEEFWATNFSVNKVPTMLILNAVGEIFAEDVSSRERLNAVFNVFPIAQRSASLDSILKGVYMDVSDLIENLWFFSLESGATPLLGAILAVATVSWLPRFIFQPKNLRRRLTKQSTRPSEAPRLVDVHGTALRGKSVYTVTIATSEPNCRFRELAEMYKGERLLAFVEVGDDVNSSHIFCTLTQKENVVVWHPSREKHQVIGDLSDIDRIKQRLHEVLDGKAQWIS